MADGGARFLRKNQESGKDPNVDVLVITPMITFFPIRFAVGFMPYVSLLPVLLLARQMRAAKYRELFRGLEAQNGNQQN